MSNSEQCNICGIPFASHGVKCFTAPDLASKGHAMTPDLASLAGAITNLQTITRPYSKAGKDVAWVPLADVLALLYRSETTVMTTGPYVAPDGSVPTTAGLSAALKAQQEQLPVGMKFAATVALSQRITELEADVLALTTALAEAKQERDRFRNGELLGSWGRQRVDDTIELAALRLQLRAGLPWMQHKKDCMVATGTYRHRDTAAGEYVITGKEICSCGFTAFLASLTPQEPR